MKRYKKLIFVDSTDTIRAPMAKVMMKKKFLLAPLEIESRGMVVLFSEPMNQKAEAILTSNGHVTQQHQATQLTQEDIGNGEGVLLLAMDSAQKEKILDEFSNLKHLHTLTEYVGGRGDMPVLYGAPLIEYGQYYELLDLLLNGLVIKLNEEEIIG